MKKGLKLLLSAAFALSIAGCANGSSNDDKTIKIGATAIPHAEILNDVVKDELEKEGYTEEEIEKIQEIDGKVVSLGPRILRTETASVVASSIVLYELSDLGGNI